MTLVRTPDPIPGLCCPCPWALTAVLAACRCAWVAHGTAVPRALCSAPGPEVASGGAVR